MKRSAVMLALVLASVMSTGCGSTRVLSEITVSPTTAGSSAKGAAVQFTATGIFTASPMVVSPFSVNWGFSGFTTIPIPTGLSIEANGLAHCGGFIGTVPVYAIHSVDPNAQPPASIAPGIGAGFVAGSAALTCSK